MQDLSWLKTMSLLQAGAILLTTAILFFFSLRIGEFSTTVAVNVLILSTAFLQVVGFSVRYLLQKGTPEAGAEADGEAGK